ncbi:nickel pincer cofactor biosynthesis protein LarC [Desulforhopalus singaporensis]|uniref:Putative nickel insertion protein n=1 Tax=Desulforhopalus singaporensis TaxID=91360 RepID=A0A1H0QWR1_9BACT|nr:nickel pincer cofactor biosynthesis protein LarC [Desulforhopalus singaporensis]SDP21732.1 hypothetical protein SAMN05660330_02108 [Desulforhopalus singaporensis]
MNAPGHGQTCYLDCFSGVSGDMLLGALLHCGLSDEELRDELAKLHLSDFSVAIQRVTINSIQACRITVDATRRQELRTLPSILGILERSGLSEEIVTKAGAVFKVLAEAEAQVHNIATDRVHFHEVGGLDTIVDIVGVVACLAKLGISRVHCSPLPAGRGFARCDHGLLPLPAPAVCELLRGIPCYGVDLRQELVTPTGAALVSVLADQFGPLPPMTITATGYGAGTTVLDNGQPNLLRCMVGRELNVAESQHIEIIETNLDDWSPEGFPYLAELLFDRGALDVTLSPLQMKKGRAGFTLQVIAAPAYAHRLKQTILTETTAIGLRFRTEQRMTLPRKKVMVATRWGEILAKQVETSRGVVIYPEYEECKKLAIKQQIPLKEVYLEIQQQGMKLI